MVQVMGLLQVIVYTAPSKLERLSQSVENSQKPLMDEASGEFHKDPLLTDPESSLGDKHASDKSSSSDGKRSIDPYDIFSKLPQSDLRNLSNLLGREGYFFLL